MFNIRIGPREESIKKFVVQLIDKKRCVREGWDDEEDKYEKCGAMFNNKGCKCHPNFCPECSAEVHKISFTLPGVIEQSSLLNHCSAKGNYH